MKYFTEQGILSIKSSEIYRNTVSPEMETEKKLRILHDFTAQGKKAASSSI